MAFDDPKDALQEMYVVLDMVQGFDMIEYDQ
jgi:hypothetical protein